MINKIFCTLHTQTYIFQYFHPRWQFTHIFIPPYMLRCIADMYFIYFYIWLKLICAAGLLRINIRCASCEWKVATLCRRYIYNINKHTKGPMDDFCFVLRWFPPGEIIGSTHRLCAVRMHHIPMMHCSPSSRHCSNTHECSSNFYIRGHLPEVFLLQKFLYRQFNIFRL